jgi:hypothetical protein
MLAALDRTKSSQVPPSKLAVALARILEVLSAGREGDKDFLWESVDNFVRKMRDRAETSETQSERVKMSGAYYTARELSR